MKNLIDSIQNYYINKIRTNIWLQAVLVASAIGIVFNFTTSNIIPIMFGFLFAMGCKKEKFFFLLKKT